MTHVRWLCTYFAHSANHASIKQTERIASIRNADQSSNITAINPLINLPDQRLISRAGQTTPPSPPLRMFRLSTAALARRVAPQTRRPYAQQIRPALSTTSGNKKAPLALGASAVATIAVYMAYERYKRTLFRSFGLHLASSAAYFFLSVYAATERLIPQLIPTAGLPPNSPFKVKPTIVFVLGGPGAGKGTQCAKVVKDFQFVHISAGDLLREERLRPGSEFGELINNYIKEGNIVPMEITIKLIEKAMLASGSNRFLIDGFPRKMDQAEEFERTVAASDFILYFSCTEEVMLKRLLKRSETSGRVDDNIDSIKKRFNTFYDTSYPVIERYKQLNKVHELSCMGTPEDVHSRVSDIFQRFLRKED